jgi:hypothetical protein
MKILYEVFVPGLNWIEADSAVVVQYVSSIATAVALLISIGTLCYLSKEKYDRRKMRYFDIARNSLQDIHAKIASYKSIYNDLNVLISITKNHDVTDIEITLKNIEANLSCMSKYRDFIKDSYKERNYKEIERSAINIYDQCLKFQNESTELIKVLAILKNKYGIEQDHVTLLSFLKKCDLQNEQQP